MWKPWRLGETLSNYHWDWSNQFLFLVRTDLFIIFLGIASGPRGIFFPLSEHISQIEKKPDLLVVERAGGCGVGLKKKKKSSGIVTTYFIFLSRRPAPSIWLFPLANVLLLPL